MKKLVLLMVLAIFIVGIVITLTPKSKKPSAPPERTTSEDAQKYLEFWTNHVAKVVFGIKHTPEPKIVERFNQLYGMISNRYGSKPNIECNLSYSSADKLVQAHSFVGPRGPTVSFRLPALMDTYYEYQTNRPVATNWYGIFQIGVCVCFMHELEHLANGLIADPKTDTFEKRIYRERVVWAYTCEYTILPIYEKSPEMLDGNSRVFCEHWLRAGRDAESREWKKFIADTHRVLRKSYDQPHL